MPTITRYRRWCKSCNDWELFSLSSEKEYTCLKCKTSHSEILLSDIPYEKVLEQQKRFKNKRREQFNSMYGMLSMPELSSSNFTSDIIESDAGLLEIEKVEREKRKKEKEEALYIIQQHKHLGRNDKCKCGSDKKYKACCLKDISKLEYKYL